MEHFAFLGVIMTIQKKKIEKGQVGRLGGMFMEMFKTVSSLQLPHVNPLWIERQLLDEFASWVTNVSAAPAHMRVVYALLWLGAKGKYTFDEINSC